MDNSIHVFRHNGKWVVKEALSKTIIAKASFDLKKKAVKFALSHKKGDKLTVYVHNFYNGTIDNIVK